MQNISEVLDVHSIIIDGNSKSGKMTFLSYLINFLYKNKAIIFTTQESYLFKRRLGALSQQFTQFLDIESSVTPYYLKDNWHIVKQKYGYEFLIKELEHIIATSDEKIVVMHRFGEFFEFQDRYEIENIYKALTKLTLLHDKKIIFLVNNKNENYEYINHVAEEFSDVSISIKSNESNERLINIKNILQNQEYPLMNYKITQNNFSLDYHKANQAVTENKVKNILIAELDTAHDNMKEIFGYILNKPNFSVKYANCLQSILQEVFIAPDVVVVLMQRSEENFKTIQTIKEQLPNTKIVGIMDQDFIRSEDMQEAYDKGCDELFANNFALETLILTMQKAAKVPFYSDAIELLPKYNNILNNFDEFRELAKGCEKLSVFFTAFSIESKIKFKKVKTSGRNNDYLFQTDYKLYYLVINTMPKDIKHIVKNYEDEHKDLVINCIWEPINNISLEECMK